MAETPEALYRTAVAEYGAALERLARGYESDPDQRRDLLQEIHFTTIARVHEYAAREIEREIESLE